MPQPDSKTHRIVLWISIALSVLGYAWFGYLVDRTQPAPLLLFIPGLFLVYVLQLVLAKQNASLFKTLFWSAIALRAIFLFSEPLLSDDVYRFLWDGRLSAHGLNPFNYTPNELLAGRGGPDIPIPMGLYALTNSPDYHTIYPPICQAIFLIPAFLFPTSIFPGIVVIRLFIFTAEIRSLFLIARLLKLENKPAWLLFIYALNPMVLIELTGNLHFEALMIMFLLEALWRWKQQQLHLCALFFGLAVSTKLIPLIFMPLFLRRLSIKQQVPFYGIVGTVTLILLIPLLSASFVAGFTESFSLYFQTFEFNASVYYVARDIGYWVKGWNTIAFNGKLMAALTFVSIFAYSLFRGTKTADLKLNMMWVWFLYLFFALTVHPWYITPLVFLAVFTGYRFPILWSMLAYITYAGYTADGYEEPLNLIRLEYVFVFGFMIYEILCDVSKPSIRNSEES